MNPILESISLTDNTDDQIVECVMTQHKDRLLTRLRGMDLSHTEAKKGLDTFVKDVEGAFERAPYNTTNNLLGITSSVTAVTAIFEDERRGPCFQVTLNLIDSDLLIQGGHGVPQFGKYVHVPMAEVLVAEWVERTTAVKRVVDMIRSINDEINRLGSTEELVRANLAALRLTEAGHGDLVNTDVLLRNNL